MSISKKWDKICEIKVNFEKINDCFFINEVDGKLAINKPIYTDLIKEIFKKSDETIACKRIFIKSKDSIVNFMQCQLIQYYFRYGLHWYSQQ